MRRSHNMTDFLPYSERAGGSPPPPLAMQLFFSTRSTSNILLSTEVQLKTPRSWHETTVCSQEPCLGHSREPVSWHLLSSLTALKTWCLVITTLIRLNFHLAFKDQRKKLWPVTDGDEMVRPISGIYVKAMWDLGRPYNRLPYVLNTAELLVDCSGQLPSPTHPWTSRAQLESNSGNTVQHRPGITSLWHIHTISLWKRTDKGPKFQLNLGTSDLPSVATLMRPHWPQKAATGWGMCL